MPAARLIAPLVVALAGALVVDYTIVAGSSDAARRVFSAQDDGTAPGVTRPREPERFGSPASTSPWHALGLQGRSFVAGGLRAPDLATLNGAPAREPIRIYAGLQSVPDTAARVRLILDELDRTGTWGRQILVVAATTGTGWANPVATQSIELMYNGDAAIVAMQYSFLPSWLSFPVDRSAASIAGQTLVQGIYRRRAQLPENRRPRLILYGEGLGSLSAEAAFDDLGDLRRSVDGALFVGPPNSNPLWRNIKDRRDPGTPEVLPTYASGLVVRFAADTEDLLIPAATSPHAITEPWMPPRVLYLQHASDPVVWWTPDLVFTRPDWLAETPGNNRVPSMRWYPIVTFWQLTADLIRATTPPPRHGHNYEDLIPAASAAIAAPKDWTAADTRRLEQMLSAMQRIE